MLVVQFGNVGLCVDQPFTNTVINEIAGTCIKGQRLTQLQRDIRRQLDIKPTMRFYCMSIRNNKAKVVYSKEEAPSVLTYRGQPSTFVDEHLATLQLYIQSVLVIPTTLIFPRPRYKGLITNESSTEVRSTAPPAGG